MDRHHQRTTFTTFPAALVALLLGFFVAQERGADPVHAAGADVVVNLSDTRQTIDGFGASDAWADNDGRPVFTDAEMDLFFSPQNGIGLSFLRLSIKPNGISTTSWSIPQRAAARGARVWAAPWSAPAAWKDNASTIDGGHLCAQAGQGACSAGAYADWATRLAGFATTLKANGVDLYALSVQNEPDWSAPYESMLYTDQEMVAFVKTLGPQLAWLSPRPKLIVGEQANWGNLWSLAGAITSDPVAASYTDMLAAHQYFGTGGDLSSYGRPVWQTEMSGFDGFDPGIDNAIGVAEWISEALTSGNVNAWHYWWLRGLNETNEGLIGRASDPFAMTKRVFAMGNFSKFVRPGWVRVGTSGGASGMNTLAFRNPSTNDVAIVVINHGGSASVTLGTSGTFLSSITPYQTYDDGSGNVAIGTHGNLEPRPAISAAGATLFTATVPHGITTFVGTSSTTQTATPPGAFNRSTPGIGVTGQSTSLTLTWGAASGATSYEYCLDTSNDNACSGWTSTGSATSAFVSGLAQATTYYWQVRATNNDGTTYADTAGGAFWAFTTLAARPSVVTTAADSVTISGATLNGIVNPSGQPTTTAFEYGPTPAYGSVVSGGTLTGTFDQPISATVALSCGTLYHFRARATNATGQEYGGNQVLVTPPCSPVVVTGQATRGTGRQVTLSGTVTPMGDLTSAWFDYGTTINYGSFVTALPAAGAGWSPVSVSATVGSLTCGVTYYFRLVGSNSGGTIAGADATVTACDVQTARGSVKGDVDGDGRADASVYRPATGAWVLSKSSDPTSGVSTYGWGVAGDLPVPGDYDGDGRLDLAIYRPSTTQWWILWSSTNFAGYAVYGWGLAGDVPVPADYDGDGKTDLAIYRPSTGGWWVLESNNGFNTYSTYGWGLPGDLPVIGDYDGDGKSDPAIYRPGSAEWWVLNSGTGYRTYRRDGWGLAGDRPVPADYDGDGGTDLGIYRPTTGEWWILKSSTGFATYNTYPWGSAGDMPAPADYDGDGRVDVAVFRPSSGDWLILTSSSDFTASITQTLGDVSDLPLTAPNLTTAP